MRHIINYLGALLVVTIIGFTFTACVDEDGMTTTSGVLGIKTFFPTKVVTNQPITISGSGFNIASEIEFPGGIKVSNYEVVNDGMIRVNAPAGIAATGGNIIVRNADLEAVSPQTLTLGNTRVTGFSVQPGDTVPGGTLITVYGSDLEFIKSIDLLDADSAVQKIDHMDFYRKGTSNLVFQVPQKNIYNGTFVGTIHTYDEKDINLPELTFEPAADEGHWETVKTTIWKNDGSLGEINWSSDYRFAPESNSTGEECYTVPQDIWERMKTETFYVTVKGASPQMRVTTGWWSTTWTGEDIFPGNERLEDLGDGVYRLTVNFANDPILDLLDAQHLLFTGGGYTVDEIFFEEETWIDGPGDQEVKVPVWTNGGALGEINWSSDYRFAPESNSTGEECYTVPQDIWERMKAETFYVTVKGASPQIRVTTGWWSTTWTGEDIFPGNERLEDLGDGLYRLTVSLAGDPILDLVDAQHLLFTGGGYTVEEIYFIDIVHGGGNSGPQETVFWNNNGSVGIVDWGNVNCRFGMDGHDDNNECIATFPEDVWQKIKTGTFYMQFKPEADWYQIRITNGWWDTQWQGADNDFSPNNMADRMIDNGDGTFYIEINFGDDPIVGTLDEKHLLFTGSGYTLLKLYFLE